VDGRLGLPENKAMKLIISTFFTLLLIGFAGGSYSQGFEETKRLSTQNYFGITPDKKYGLPNNIGAYSDETGIISSCLSLYDKGKPITLGGQNYFGVAFKIKSLQPPTITLIDSRIFNESELKTSSGEAPYCSGAFESSTMIYQDTIQVGSIPHYIAFKLVDDINYDFELTDSSTITEKADIAFVLRGYNGTAEYNFPASFRADAKRALKGFSELSFGAISSYRIFDGGIDPNGPDYYQSLEDIKTIDAALSGWTGSWAIDANGNRISGMLINPTDEEISVLQSLRQWLVDSKKGAREGWQETELGAVHYNAWVSGKVLFYGGTAASSYLNGLRLPTGLKESNFKTIGVILSSTDKYNARAVMSSCKELGITQSDGQPFPGNAYAGPQIYPTSKEKQAATGDEVFTCFYVDYSNGPDIIAPEFLAALNAWTTVHEAIHALGHHGHDLDENRDYFPYGVMTLGGKVDQYPIWNRVFLLGWLPESTITDDPTLVADTYGATDPNAKYLLRLGPQNDFDCISYKLVTLGGITGNDNTDIRKCYRYQELYNGNWVQYKAPYTEGGSTWHPVGVTYEPLNDLADTKAPEIILTNGNAVEIEQDELEQRFIKVRFDEKINLGKGYVVINEADGTQLISEQTNRLPEVSSVNLEISGYLLKIDIGSGFMLKTGQDYSLVFSDGAITDRAGNSVVSRSYEFSYN
jgi:hypothetical protein